MLPGPTYLPGPNCLVLETGYVFLLHLSYTHRHFPNKLLCLHLLTCSMCPKNPCPHLSIEADVHSPVGRSRSALEIKDLFCISGSLLDVLFFSSVVPVVAVAAVVGCSIRDGSHNSDDGKDHDGLPHDVLVVVPPSSQ